MFALCITVFGLAMAGVQLGAGSAAVSVEAGGDWKVSLTILNRGDGAAQDVEISSVSLNGARVVTPLPVSMGEVSDSLAGTASVQLSSASNGVMTIGGSYREQNRRLPFSLRYTVSTIEQPPGFAVANSAPEPSRFTHQKTFTEGVAAVEIGGKWGYIDRVGTLRIPAQFDGAEPFSGGKAKVRVGKQVRYIDHLGITVP